MDNSFVNGFINAFVNWKSLIINIIIAGIILLINFFFIETFIETWVSLSAVNNTGLFSTLYFYLITNPLDVILFIIALILFIFLTAFAVSKTLSLADKQKQIAGFWKIVGLNAFIFLIMLVFFILLALFSFNVWVLLIFAICSIIFFLWLTLKLFFLIPEIGLNSETFKDAWNVANTKINKKWVSTLIIVIAFHLILNAVEYGLVSSYATIGATFFIVFSAIIWGFFTNWILMTMYHKY